MYMYIRRPRSTARGSASGKRGCGHQEIQQRVRDQQQQQKPLQQQEEKVAKIHSSSKRKKQPKSSFSMGFRSYVRHFRGAILGLLRPSLPWCFPIRGPAAAAAKASAAAGVGSSRQQPAPAAKASAAAGVGSSRQQPAPAASSRQEKT